MKIDFNITKQNIMFVNRVGGRVGWSLLKVLMNLKGKKKKEEFFQK